MRYVWISWISLECQFKNSKRINANFHTGPLNHMFWPCGHSKKSGTCLNASGVFFASDLQVKTIETIVESIASKYMFGFPTFWQLFCQPFGENTLRQNTPPKHEPIKHIVISWTLKDLCARTKFNIHTYTLPALGNNSLTNFETGFVIRSLYLLTWLQHVCHCLHIFVFTNHLEYLHIFVNVHNYLKICVSMSEYLQIFVDVLK